MKVNDLDGRIMNCAARALLVAQTLEGWADLVDYKVWDGESITPEALHALAKVSEKLSDELEELRNAYADESDERDAKKQRAIQAWLESKGVVLQGRAT